jgi:hypothetical protein
VLRWCNRRCFLERRSNDNAGGSSKVGLRDYGHYANGHRRGASRATMATSVHDIGCFSGTLLRVLSCSWFGRIAAIVGRV